MRRCQGFFGSIMDSVVEKGRKISAPFPTRGWHAPHFQGQWGYVPLFRRGEDKTSLFHRGIMKMSGTNLVPLFGKEGSGEILLIINNCISLISLFAFSKSPLAPLFQRGDNKDAKCPPSRGYHTKRHRAGFFGKARGVSRRSMPIPDGPTSPRLKAPPEQVIEVEHPEKDNPGDKNKRIG